MNRPTWEQYFLDIAYSVSKRSTCLRRQYGAVIVKDNVIVGTGFNGAPRGESNCTDTNICVRQQLNVPAGERYELCVAVHAEQNAIINSTPSEMVDATIYVAGHNIADGSFASGQPCLLCRRMIQNARIKEAVFFDGEKVVTIKSSEIGK